MITQTELKRLLSYDPETGVFTWQITMNNRVSAGATAGSNSQGYLRIRLHKKNYLSHRLVWLYTHGSWPPGCLDHIDGNRSNNRISNLREATNSENKRNSTTPSNNTSGFKGVSWAPHIRKWFSQLKVNGHYVLQQYFLLKEDAITAVREARELHHGDFANHG